ncbi:MAG: hypothetical protein [Olavius algarvensis Gamma 3 endosymbiont]|nr:MAG: hypothetical protein [Olavius algarvensis Gamma 3 endosymbiont]
MGLVWGWGVWNYLSGTLSQAEWLRAVLVQYCKDKMNRPGFVGGSIS